MTREQAEKHLAAWESADLAASKGQSYSIDGLSLSRVDADLITKKIDYWQRKINQFIACENGEQPGIKTASFN